jgi:hypothetical protein
MIQHTQTANSTTPGATGFVRHALAVIVGVLKRGIPGKSGNNYMRQFTGNDEYWDCVIAAQKGWPRGGVSRNETTRSTGIGTSAVAKLENGDVTSHGRLPIAGPAMPPVALRPMPR